MVVRQHGIENGADRREVRTTYTRLDHASGSLHPTRSTTVRRRQQVWFSIVYRCFDGELSGWDGCAPNSGRWIFHSLSGERLDGLQHSWPGDADIEMPESVPRNNHLMFCICDNLR